MPQMIETCAQCGDQFKVYDQGRTPIYCSQACRQKAYRERKKEQKEATERMLTFEQKRTENEMIKHGDRPVHDQLNNFIKVHGIPAYKDLLNVVDVFLNQCSKNS